MFNASDSYNDWIKIVQTYSKKYQKFRSFLPPQERLLKEVYDGIFLLNEKVVSFTAPPASGKTHVIALCATYLKNKGLDTCIITPNSELKSDFLNEMKDVDTTSMIPVMSIKTYKKAKGKLDYALMDEAHNLRSAIELDDSIVKSFHFQHPDALYEVLTSGLDTSKYVTRELNIEAASDVLKNMLKTEHKRQAQYLLRTLTQWRVFCVIFQDTCDLKFLIANPKTRNLLPKGRLFLFSATRLEEEELEFYCDIPKSILKTVGETETKFIPKDNVAYHYIVCTTDEQKIDLTINALNRTSSPTLILLNNNRNCLKWNDALSKALGERVVLVRSGLNYNERLDAFQEFARGPDKILLSSSNVYWEGITIKELKLLIIPNIPFPQPTLLELAEGKNPEYLKIAKRRLIQGIGRIGRAPQTKGTCILLFQPPKSLSYFKEASIDQALSSIN